MRIASRNVTMIAAAIAVAVSAAGCTSLFPPNRGPAPASMPPAQHGLDVACETVNAEWGFALDPWEALEADSQRKDFAQKQTEHQSVISNLQDIADRVAAPELRQVLDASISAHQQYADTIWPGLAAVPAGYAVDLNDPTNLLVVLGQQETEFERQMSDANVQRYDLCGVMQSGQTATQACEIADGEWVDAGLVYSGASGAAAIGDVPAAQRQATDGLAQLKAALAQVTVSEVHTEMAGMYDAYETYYEDVISGLLTEEQVLQLSADEVDAYVSEGDTAFAAWDDALTAGEERLSAYCADQG